MPLNAMLPPVETLVLKTEDVPAPESLDSFSHVKKVSTGTECIVCMSNIPERLRMAYPNSCGCSPFVKPPICEECLQKVVMLVYHFHTNLFFRWDSRCPQCRRIFKRYFGNGPDGTMTVEVIETDISKFFAKTID
jgi:hypothetical protein